MLKWLGRLWNSPESELRAEEVALRRDELRARRKLLESSMFQFDNMVDPREPFYDANDFWVPLDGGESVPPNIDKRGRGEVLPVYLSEIGLKFIRDRSRHVVAYNEFAINAVQNRISYIVGTGFKYKLVRKKRDPLALTQGQSDELCDAGQAIIDRFCADSDWGQLEQEIVLRGDRDGESILRFFQSAGGLPAVRLVEPEWVHSDKGFESDTSFGVVNEPGDVETVRGYMIRENPAYSSAVSYVPAEEILHIKCNADRNSKRGLPILLPVHKNLARAEKLLRNMATLAQVQATFALIRKHTSFSAASIQAYQEDQVDVQTTAPLTNRTRNFQQLMPGTIIDAPANVEYEFPSSSVNASQYVAVLQAELRAVGAALVMPEYMISGDASNANYASTMVAEAPSIKNFERWQSFYARKFGKGVYRPGKDAGVMWRVLEAAVRSGRLDSAVLTECELHVEGQNLAVRDRTTETMRLAQLNARGIISKTDWATEEGYDYHQQQLQIAAEGEGQPGGVDGMGGAGDGQIQIDGMNGAEDGGAGGGTGDKANEQDVRGIIVRNRWGTHCHYKNTGMPAQCPPDLKESLEGSADDEWVELEFDLDEGVSVPQPVNVPISLSVHNAAPEPAKAAELREQASPEAERPIVLNAPITIHMPEQPAAQVHVEPAQVTVNNEPAQVNVQPADVTVIVPPRRTTETATVLRDADGRMAGFEKTTTEGE